LFAKMVQSSKIILLSAAATGLGLAMWKVFKNRKLRKSDDSSSSNGKNQFTVEDATLSNFDSPPAEDYNIHEVDAPESLNVDSEEQYSQLQVEEDDSSQLQVDEDSSSELRADADGSSHVQASEQKSLQTASLLEHADETAQLISSTAVSATSDSSMGDSKAIPTAVTANKFSSGNSADRTENSEQSSNSELNKKSNYFKKVVVCLRVDEANNRNDETALPDSITYDKAVSLKNRLFSDEKNVFLAALNEILKASAFPVNHAVFREAGVVPLMKNMLLEEKCQFDSERLLLQALCNFAADPENRNYLKQSCVPYLIGNYLKTKDKHHHREVVNLLVSLSSEIDEENEVHYSKIIPHIFTEMYACRKGQKSLRQMNLSFLVNLSTNKALCHAMIPNLDKKYETYFHEKCNEEETLVKLLAMLDNIFGHVVFSTDSRFSVELPSGAERECFFNFCKFLKNKSFFKELSKHQNDEIRIRATRISDICRNVVVPPTLASGQNRTDCKPGKRCRSTTRLNSVVGICPVSDRQFGSGLGEDRSSDCSLPLTASRVTERQDSKKLRRSPQSDKHYSDKQTVEQSKNNTAREN
ncbi:hypothetical protein T07_5685, partial [Trichinella nelsoni]